MPRSHIRLNQLCQLHSYWPCLSRIDHFESKRQNLSSNLEHGILENSQFLANVIFQIDKCQKSTIIFLQIRLALSRGTILQRASFADIVSVNKDTWKEVVGGVPNLIKKMRSCSK